MSEHFIKEIEIKNYKLFKDFKASGFSRVNLIGGKNNVGKTAFMEACYLSTDYPTLDSINYSKVVDSYLRLIELATYRNGINLQYNFKTKEQDIEMIINATKNGFKTIRRDFNLKEYKTELKIDNYIYNFVIVNSEYKYNYKDLFQLLNFNIQNTRQHFTTNFNVASNSYPHFMFDYIISNLKAKLDNKTNQFMYDALNKIIDKLFGYKRIDILQGAPELFIENNHFPLHQFGQGIKSFIYNIGAILLAQNQVIFIDEVENGLHYSLFDNLWEIILTITREQNVQVFATTHSKEFIESFNRVSKKLEDREALYFEMIKNEKKDKIYMRALDVNQLEYELTHNGDFRG